MPANIGVPMIGSYMNVMLYTLVLVEAYIYYFASPRSSKDSIFLKGCVATSLVSDTVGTIGVCALTFVSNLVFTDTITPRKLYWAFQMYIVSNTVSAFIFQCYMAHRHWILSRNYVLSTFIALLILASLGTNINLLVNNLAIVTREMFQETRIHVNKHWIIVVLVTAMLTDLIITTSLFWQLRRSGLYNDQSLRTKKLVARIWSLAFKTGAIPCVFALIILVTYVSYKNQNLATFFGYMLGRVYTTTLLYSLIYRDKLFSNDEPPMDADPMSLPSMTFSFNSVHRHFRMPPMALPSKGRPRHSMFSNDKSHDLTASNPTTTDTHTFE